MRRACRILPILAIALFTAVPAQAGQYGHRLDRDSASGDWYDMPAAAASGRVAYPTSFTVVVKGHPTAGPECVNNPYGCDERVAIWDVACKKNGRMVSRQGGTTANTTAVGHPRLPMKHPTSCTISAGGSLSYGAGGSVQVTVYYRN